MSLHRGAALSYECFIREAGQWRAAGRPAKLHRFTTADYRRMAEAGIPGEDSRVELIRGQIVDMAPTGAPHLGLVDRLNRMLSALLGGCDLISRVEPRRALAITALPGVSVAVSELFQSRR